MMSKRLRLHGLVLGLAVAGMGSGVFGLTTETWDGTNNSWNTAADWSPGVVPQNGTPAGSTYAVVVNGGQVNVTGINPTVTSITMGGNGVIQDSGTQTLTVTGATTIGVSSSITFGTGATGSFGTVDSSGNFFTGFGFTGSNTVSTSGLFKNESGATLRIFGPGDVANFNSFTNLGTAIINAGATLKITGGGSGITDVAAGSNLQVDGTLSVVNGATTTNGLANLATVEGSLLIDNGQTTTMGTVTISTTGVFQVGADVAGTVVSAGNISNSGLFTTGFGFASGSTLNTSGTFTNAVGATLRVWGNGDVANLHGFSNLGTAYVNTGATLKITGGGSGITDVPANSNLQVFGTLSVVNGNVTTNGLANLASVEGVLVVDNGQTTSTGAVSVSASGIFALGADATGTTLSATSFNNFGTFELGFGFAGGSTVNTSGTFTNKAGATFRLWSSGDKANFNAFSNLGSTVIGAGATLKITGGGSGITDVPANSSLQVNGTLSVVNGATTTNALANLATIEGVLIVDNGQTTTTGALSVASTGTYSMGADIAGTVLTTTSVNNSGTFELGFGVAGGSTSNTSGTFTNAASGTVRVWSSGDVMNVNAFVNLGATTINPGATLKITGGGLGFTDIPANSALHVLGTFSVVNGIVTSNALSNLATVEGALEIGNGAGTTVGNVTISSSGQMFINNGTTFSAANITNSGFFGSGFGGNGNNTVNVSGTFTNNSSGTVNMNGVGDVWTNVITLSNAGTINDNTATLSLQSLTGTGGVVNLNGNVLTINGGNSTNLIRDNGSLGTLITNNSVTTGAVQLAKLSISGHQTISSPFTASKVSVLALPGVSGNWTGGVNLTPFTRLVVEDTATHAATLTAVKSEVAFGITHPAGIYSTGLLAGQVMVVSNLAVTDGATPAVTNVQGVPTDSGSILVMPTYLGDANMDGVVNLLDLQALANHWQQTVTDWRQADFDGNGKVELQDLQAIANHWQAGVGVPGSGAGESDGMSFGEALSLVGGLGGASSVPEPGTIGVLMVGAGMLLKGRRRA